MTEESAATTPHHRTGILFKYKFDDPELLRTWANQRLARD